MVKQTKNKMEYKIKFPNVHNIRGIWLNWIFSLKLAKPILYFFGFNREIFNDIFLGDFIYWLLRLTIIFPIYQLLLIFFGFLFFQFSFFWELEKKILTKIGFGSF